MRLFAPLLLAVLFFPASSPAGPPRGVIAQGTQCRKSASPAPSPSPVNDARDAALSNLPGDLLQLLE